MAIAGGICATAGNPHQTTLGYADATAPTASFPNPYGCIGKSGYPHLSGHNQGSVSAYGETYCGSPQPYQYVESWLYRWDCFLIFCGRSLIGYDSSAKMIGKSVFAHPNNPCNGSSTHRYRILSYHEVHGRNGHTYTGWTGRTRDVACG